MAYTALGNLCVYLLACNHWSEFVPHHAIFCVEKGWGKKFNVLEFPSQSRLAINWQPYFEAEQSNSGREENDALQWAQTLNCANTCKVFQEGMMWQKQQAAIPAIQMQDIGWNKTIETYCSCGIGEWMCKDCYGQHMGEVTKQIAQGGNYFIILKIWIFYVMLYW